MNSAQFSAPLVVTILLIGVLVTALLLGAFVIVNLGLMSKRPQDRTGERTPSDVGILKGEMWPEAPYSERVLPAEEAEEEPSELPVKKAG